MEMQLFDWDGWDEIEVFVNQFYDVKLKVPIGEFPVGTEFDCAVVDCNNGILSFHRGNKELAKFKLTFNVLPFSD